MKRTKEQGAMDSNGYSALGAHLFKKKKRMICVNFVKSYFTSVPMIRIILQT